MMGYSHTVSAAAGWLILAETGVVQVPDTPTLIVTTLACAGAGMLPDIDHHNGSIARYTHSTENSTHRMKANIHLLVSRKRYARMNPSGR